MLLAEVVATSDEVGSTRSRTRKVDLLASLLARAEPAERALTAAYLAGQLPQGRVAVGYRTIGTVRPPPAPEPRLRLLDVDATVERLAGLEGPGSRTARTGLLHELLASATDREQAFLRGLLLGELRQGALAAVLAQAVARAAGVGEHDVRRALMLQADIGEVAQVALAEGGSGLEAFRLRLFRPLQPMLAQTSAGIADAVAAGAGRQVLVEWKLDGARIQVHRDGADVAVYTRTLKEVTDRHPEVVAAAAALPVGSVVLDGEVIALRADGRPHPFQDTMRRVGSRRDLARRSSELGLTPFFFDVLHADGDDLLDRPLAERRAALLGIVPEDGRLPGTVTGDVAVADDVLAGALAAGHEGVMVKDLETPYEAGRRGAAWRKVKPSHTLDLVVLAVEWGSGRRRGWLSNVHLGARDPAGGFVMLGKTFKGMTDEMLAWQTRRFLELETARDGHVVHVRPAQVVEVAFDGVQASPRYPGGVALRFARVKRYRDDKPASEADTIDSVRAIAERS